MKTGVATETRKKKGKAAGVQMEMCSVKVGDMLFGVPITQILEIVGSSATQAVPLAPSFIGGLVHYRGDVLTTVSLRLLLGLPPVDTLPDIVVFEGPSGYYGLLVDAVGEVITVTSTEFEPNPSTLDASRQTLFAGAYKLKEGLLVMLDPERLDPLRLSSALPA